MDFLPLQYTDILKEWGLPEVLTLGGTLQSATATGPVEE